MGKRTSCSFTEGSDINRINLIFILNLLEEKNSLSDTRTYQIFIGFLDPQKSQGSAPTWWSGHSH